MIIWMLLLVYLQIFSLEQEYQPLLVLTKRKNNNNVIIIDASKEF